VHLLDQLPGKIRFACHNFRIPQLHPHAEQAAEAAEAAAAGEAAIGPPPGLYQPTERAARRACTVFVQAARLSAAAARAYTTAGTGPAARTFNNLLNRTDAAVSRGIYLIDNAYYGAPVIAP
jgi:hypothetical protein